VRRSVARPDSPKGAGVVAVGCDDIRPRHIPADLQSRLFRNLQMIDNATTDQDLRVLPSNHFEKLRGARADFHSIRWNSGQGEASEIYLDDHSYR
jgi:proteic killer suppression protein